MKKLFTSIICLLMALTVVGCSSADTTPNVPPVEPEIPEETEKAPETDEYILENGISDYKIVIAEDASKTIQYAAKELQFFFKNATNYSLPIVSDVGLTYNENAKYLSIGENNVFESADITLDKATLKRSGVRLITEGNSLFMCGGQDDGALYAVYTWLEQEFDYEFYYTDIWTIDTDVKNLKLRDYDLTDIPDFDYRIYTNKQIHESVSTGSRLRVMSPLNNKKDLLILGNSQSTDGVLGRTYVPKAKYQSEHPGWYSPSNNHVCLTGSSNMDGEYNEAEYNALINELSNILIQSFQMDLEGDRVVFGGADEGLSCTCKTCEAEREVYGEFVGSMVKVANAVRVKVDEWMNSEAGEPFRRYWTLEILSYAGYVEPPVKVDENGNKYATIECVKGVIPFWAPLNTEWLLSIEHEDNTQHREYVNDWKLCTDEFSGWLYSTNYKDYMVHLDTYKTVLEYMKIMNDYSCDYMFIEGQYAQTGLTTGWDMLQNYILCKLMWDLDLDVNKLIDNWFDTVYGPASNIMRQIYQESCVNLQRMGSRELMGDNVLRRGKNAYRDMLKADYYPKSLLLRWLDMYDQAIETVALEGGTEMMTKMIRAERISTMYTYLELNYTTLTAPKVNEYATQFFNDCDYVQLYIMREASDLTNRKTLKTKYALYGYEE